MTTFSEFKMQPGLAASLAEQGITEPTEIQARAIPPLLKGESLLGVSATGTGKTLAYVLPLLHRLKEVEIGSYMVSEPGRPRGLVLVPGRELGEQVGKVFKGLTHLTRLRVRLALGGTAKRVSRKSVSRPHEILVASPGRLAYLMDMGDLSLKDVRMVAIDEADQVLDPGFLPAARRILRKCRRGTQVMLFSATLPDHLEGLVEKLLDGAPTLIRAEGSGQLVPTVHIDNRMVVDGRRRELLAEILAEEPGMGTLLFANTRGQVDRMAEWLDDFGFDFVLYRGEMDRIERRRNLEAFRDGEVDLLLTTDLGGRGLDIERVDRVVNVHLPREVSNYIHRAGRTARAGRTGTVVNMVTERDAPLMEAVEGLQPG